MLLLSISHVGTKILNYEIASFLPRSPFGSDQVLKLKTYSLSGNADIPTLPRYPLPAFFQTIRPSRLPQAETRRKQSIQTILVVPIPSLKRQFGRHHQAIWSTRVAPSFPSHLFPSYPFLPSLLPLSSLHLDLLYPYQNTAYPSVHFVHLPVIRSSIHLSIHLCIYIYLPNQQSK